MGADGELAFRFRPRFRAFPWMCIGIGLGLLAASFISGREGPSRTFALLCAVLGPTLGLLYLAAPAWRFVVVVDDDALAVRHGSKLRFRLPWSEIARVVHSPESHTLYVDGGAGARSFLLPGPGAPAPYRVESREELYDLIIARAPRERLVEVASLRDHKVT